MSMIELWRDPLLRTLHSAGSKQSHHYHDTTHKTLASRETPDVCLQSTGAEMTYLHTPPGLDPCFVIGHAGCLQYARRFVIETFFMPGGWSQVAVKVSCPSPWA